MLSNYAADAIAQKLRSLGNRGACHTIFQDRLSGWLAVYIITFRVHC